MTAFVAMVVDGVLRQETGDGVIPQGNALYQLFKDTGRLALITNDREPEYIQHWLEVNGYHEHQHLVTRDATDLAYDAPEIRLRQLIRLQQIAGGQMSFYVEPDPASAALALSRGFAVLTFLHPRYMRPSFRPDFKEEVTPWDRLVAEVELQRTLRAKDARPHEEVK